MDEIHVVCDQGALVVAAHVLLVLHQVIVELSIVLIMLFLHFLHVVSWLPILCSQCRSLGFQIAVGTAFVWDCVVCSHWNVVLNLICLDCLIASLVLIAGQEVVVVFLLLVLSHG